MEISAPLLNMLIEFAQVSGIQTNSLLSNLDDPSINLCDEEQRVSNQEYLQILQAVIEELEDPFPGVSYGCYLNLKALGIIHQISLHASNIFQAINLLNQYLESSFPLVKVEVNSIDSEFGIRIHSPVKDPVLNEAIVTSTTCLVYRELTLMLGDFEMDLAVPDRLQDEFDARLGITSKRSDSFLISLNQDILNETLNSKVLKYIAALLPRFMMTLEQSPFSKNSFAHQVWQMTLNLASPELPTLNMVTRQFAMSDRNFQRKLTAEQTSYRNISNRIKQKLSEYLEEDQTLKTQEIAHLLGYADSSAYLHALKSWSA